MESEDFGGDVYIATEYLNAIISKTQDKITLYLKKEHPLSIEMFQNNASLVAMIATRIDEGD